MVLSLSYARAAIKRRSVPSTDEVLHLILDGFSSDKATPLNFHFNAETGHSRSGKLKELKLQKEVEKKNGVLQSRDSRFSCLRTEALGLGLGTSRTRNRNFTSGSPGLRTAIPALVNMKLWNFGVNI